MSKNIKEAKNERKNIVFIVFYQKSQSWDVFDLWPGIRR
jgi:hypothetical protein